MTTLADLRCGDTVLHRPTGETWVVAYTEASRDELSWLGWPDGRAKLSDCEVLLHCSDAEHRAVLERVADAHGDHRQRRAARDLAALTGEGK